MMQTRRRFLFGLGTGLTFAVQAGFAVAQSPQPVQAPRPLDLLFIGDSLAQGLVLNLLGRRPPGIRPENATQHATGITMYHQLDWLQKLDEQLRRRRFDAVAMSIGLNDFRPLVDGRARFDFDTEGFTERYGARVEALIERCERDATEVFWVGLPIIKHERNNRAMRRLDAIQRASVERRGATWIDTAVLTSPDGSYTPALAEAGRPARQIRAEDGTHFTRDGYTLINGALLRAIGARMPQFASVAQG
jgi:uncharacterized protein